MPYPIEKKLVVAVSSSALFDLSESDAVYKEKGEETYRQYQRDKQNATLAPGVAFPFIRRFLGLNLVFADQQPVEVVLLSHNDPDTGLRVFTSIRKHGLNITRAAFLCGGDPFKYIPAFNVSLFLSANPRDVKNAIDAGSAAGTVLGFATNDDPADRELRVAFDFDGVIADDEAEAVYSVRENLQDFHQAESHKAGIPHEPGPLKDLVTKLSFFQKLERKREAADPSYKRLLRTAIVTARNAPSHERMVTTLRNWGVIVDETFFLGGIDKSRILKVLRPHIYFDDQMSHLAVASGTTPVVHIPFGVRNEKSGVPT
jgi:5'-nucleotidase